MFIDNWIYLISLSLYIYMYIYTRINTCIYVNMYLYTHIYIGETCVWAPNTCRKRVCGFCFIGCWSRLCSYCSSCLILDYATRAYVVFFFSQPQMRNSLDAMMSPWSSLHCTQYDCGNLNPNAAHVGSTS